MAASLLLCVANAQTGNSAAQGPDKSVYAELGKVPAKAAARPNPLESDSRGCSSRSQTLRAALCGVSWDECRGWQEGAQPAHGRSATGHAGFPLLADDERRGPQGYAGMVPAAGTAALATGQLHQVAGHFPDAPKTIVLKDFPNRVAVCQFRNRLLPLATFPSPLASNCSVTIKGWRPEREALIQIASGNAFKWSVRRKRDVTTRRRKTWQAMESSK